MIILGRLTLSIWQHTPSIGNVIGDDSKTLYCFEKLVCSFIILDMNSQRSEGYEYNIDLHSTFSFVIL